MGGGFEGATKTNKIFKSGWGVACFWVLWGCGGLVVVWWAMIVEFILEIFYLDD